MFEWTTIATSILAAIAAGGWLKSRHDRRLENESHEKELVEKEAEIISKLRESETKYTREALEIYTQQVVVPLREQLRRNTEAIARYQGAIDMAPHCRIYPDCVIVRKLRSKENDNRDPRDEDPESN